MSTGLTFFEAFALLATPIYVGLRFSWLEVSLGGDKPAQSEIPERIPCGDEFVMKSELRE